MDLSCPADTAQPVPRRLCEAGGGKLGPVTSLAPPWSEYSSGLELSGYICTVLG